MSIGCQDAKVNQLTLAQPKRLQFYSQVTGKKNPNTTTTTPMPGLRKAIDCRVPYFAGSQTSPFTHQMELCPLLPQRAGWHCAELRIKWVKRQRVKRRAHPGQTERTQRRQEQWDTAPVCGLSPYPPRSCSPPTPINLSFEHCFVIFKESKMSTIPNPKPCCNFYPPLLWPGGTALSSHRIIRGGKAM